MVLDGKVIAITGASSGIGEATARACATAGARVELAARRSDRLERVALEIQADALHAWYWDVDVCSPVDCKRMVDEIVKYHGRLDALVLNAGLMLLGPADGREETLDDWQRMVDTNLSGAMYCTHYALPHLRESRGDLVFVGSVLGRTTQPLSAAYCATKFGITAFADALRKELVPDGVRVTVVEPGRVETELRSHIRPENREQLGEVFPAFDGLTPETVADCIVYALQQPPEVSVSDILVRPVASVL